MPPLPMNPYVRNCLLGGVVPQLEFLRTSENLKESRVGVRHQMSEDATTDEYDDGPNDRIEEVEHPHCGPRNHVEKGGVQCPYR